MKTLPYLFVMAFVYLNCLMAQANEASVTVLIAYYSTTGHTETMAHAVQDGARNVPDTKVWLKRVEDVSADELFSADALIVGSPVYWSNMAGPVKTFFDNWQFKFGVFPDFKMRNKIGAAFTTGGQAASGKEFTLLSILAAMLGNHMIVVGGGGAFGASATTEGDSPGIDQKEMMIANELGRRVAEVTHLMQSGKGSARKERSSAEENPLNLTLGQHLK